MRRAVAVLVLGFCMSPGVSLATPMTCGQLKNYIEGTAAVLNFDPGAELLGVVATHPELCIPRGTILGTLRAVFVHWGDSNPKLMNMPSWDCAARAFRESFPCEQAIPKSDRAN
jgi:hypothetical protein